MKVLHVESGMHLYGGARQVVFITQGLAKRGVQNIVVCPKGSEIAKATKGFATVIETKIGGDIDILFIARLIKIIRETKPDIVHLHSRRGADVLGGIAAKLTNTPCILSRRVDNPENRAWAAIKYTLYDKIIAISERIKRVLLDEGVDGDKIVCVRSAVDSSAYERDFDREWFLREFGLPSGSLTIGVIAQLIPRKGHRFLLEIAPKLLAKHPNLKIIFFGKGALEGELRESVREMGLEKSVYFAGFRDDLASIIGSLDLVVHPALMEGLGVSLLQASAAGVPIVAFSAGGIPEVVRDDINGFLVEPENSEELFEKIDLLLSNQALRDRLSKGAKELAKMEFGVDAMVDGNLWVYKNILDKRGSA